MFDELQNAAEDSMRDEFHEIEQWAKNNGSTDPLLHWDIAFWSERLREDLFDYTDDQLRPYFPLPKVLNGLFDLCEHLFEIKIERTNINQFNSWNDSVMFFAVKRGNTDCTFLFGSILSPRRKTGRGLDE